MIWVLVAALGSVAWLSVVSFFLALCHAAGRADELAQAEPAPNRQLALAGGSARRDGNILYLHTFQRRAPLQERQVRPAPTRVRQARM